MVRRRGFKAGGTHALLAHCGTYSEDYLGTITYIIPTCIEDTTYQGDDKEGAKSTLETLACKMQTTAATTDFQNWAKKECLWGSSTYFFSACLLMLICWRVNSGDPRIRSSPAGSSPRRHRSMRYQLTYRCRRYLPERCQHMPYRHADCQPKLCRHTRQRQHPSHCQHTPCR